MIAIIGAVREEVRPVARRLGMTCIHHDGLLYVYHNASEYPDVLLVQSGVGRGSAEEACAHVTGAYPVSGLISFGFSGALREDLAIGDLVLCTDVRVDETLEAKMPRSRVDDRLRHRVSRTLEHANVLIRIGRCVTSTVAISDPSEKRRLAEASGADIVDMEAGWIGRMAHGKGLPFVALRTISDCLGDPIPSLGEPSLDDGRISRRCIALNAVRHPGTLAALLRLARNIWVAQHRLTRAVCTVVETWERSEED